MITGKFWFQMIALSGLLAVGQLALAAEITLSGVVRDNAGKPVPQTTIRIYDAGGRPIAGKHSSGVDGTYSISLNTETPNISLDFDSTFYHVRGIRSLSTLKGDNQQINPVMLDKRGPNSFALILEQVATYDTIFWREYSEIPTERTRTRLRDQYLERIVQMPDPRKLNAAHPQVYAANAPQRKVLGGLSLYQHDILETKLKQLEECYNEPAKAPTNKAPSE